MKVHQCTSCGYVYDQNVGELEYGIEPGIAFENLSSHWLCPMCSSGKNEFQEKLSD